MYAGVRLSHQHVHKHHHSIEIRAFSKAHTVVRTHWTEQIVVLRLSHCTFQNSAELKFLNRKLNELFISSHSRNNVGNYTTIIFPQPKFERFTRRSEVRNQLYRTITIVLRLSHTYREGAESELFNFIQSQTKRLLFIHITIKIVGENY